MTRWGKAGQRLSAEEAEKRDRARAAKANQRRAAHERMLEEAHRGWAGGRVVPARITTALDLRSLYGPEVDVACGTEEPAVDEWEAGVRYPTWEQLQALAALTGMLPVWFIHEPLFGGGVAFICDRTKRTNGCQVVDVEPGPLEFTLEARRAVLGADHARR